MFATWFILSNIFIGHFFRWAIFSEADSESIGHPRLIPSYFSVLTIRKIVEVFRMLKSYSMVEKCHCSELKIYSTENVPVKWVQWCNIYIRITWKYSFLGTFRLCFTSHMTLGIGGLSMLWSTIIPQFAM